MKVTGKVVREDLGAGAWFLVSREGARYALAGGDDGLFQDGQTVTVEGSVDEGGGIGIGMTGDPVLSVERYTQA